MKNGMVIGLAIVSAAMLLASIAFFVASAPSRGDAADEAKPKGNFDKNVIDIGIIVSDVAKAAAFYTNALGFTEAEGFDVPAAMSKDSGLTDGQTFKVRVFTTADKGTSTKIKLMEFPKALPKKIENTYLNSSLGFRYITIFVNDTAAAVARAKKAGVTPIKEPYKLADGKNFLTLVRDPDGNIVELVGPKL
jgi:catechol 2,3-dioxygenase-like lactoylglutathione lyase family enzyme